MNIATNLERCAFYFPTRPALSEGDVEVTYGQLNERANRVATALLQLGVEPGERIALCSPNSADWIAFYFGVLKTGAVAVTLSTLLKPDEMDFFVNHAQPRVMFTSDDKLDVLHDLKSDGCLEKIICPKGELPFHQLLEKGTSKFKALDMDRSDTAAILYTGGTTGIPKGALLSHENINAAIHTVILSERSLETDRALCFLPLNHVFGQMHITNATILSAGCVEIMPSFDMDRILYLMEKGRITKFLAVPTIYVRFLALDRLKERLGTVRYCFSAAASMAADLVRQWKERTGLAIYEGYGMTEAAPTVTYNHPYKHVIGSVGTEVAGVEVQIRDQNGDPVAIGGEGEICVRGRNIMKGYLNNPEETSGAFWQGEWFRSGDVGYVDDDGYLYIVDRIKDMIITGGENVYSREVEEVLYTRPEIEECAVIGLPDEEWGERVTASIILKPGETIDKNELTAFLKSHLSSFKVPKEFFFVDDLPRSSAGKILKRELRKQYLK